MDTDGTDGGWRASVATWTPVVVVAALSQSGLGMDTPWTGSDLALAVTGLASALPLAWRHRRPLGIAAAVAIVLAVQAHLQGGSLHFGSFVAAVLATYAVARHSADLGRALAGGAVVAVGVLVAMASSASASPLELLFPAFHLSMAWLAGRAIRIHEVRGDRLRELAAGLERERDQGALLAAANERVRIARELHDLLAHTVGVMVVQAEAAEECLTTDPDATGRALQTIQRSGREGMQDLRHLLGVLRDDGDGAGGPMRPQPDLTDLDELIGDFEEAGMDVELERAGDLHTVPSGIQLSVFRVAQEALSNALRHSTASTAHVELRCDGAAVHVRISDPGPARSTGRPGGHGLIGMRERVAAFGGDLRAGPAPAGGYEVAASIPLRVTTS